MVKLYHYTAPYAARMIAEQQTYYGGASFEDGLNVVPSTSPWQPSPGYSWTGAKFGALLEFEWKGPTVKRECAGTAPNTLYDLGVHRLFIPAGTDQHLRLIGMQLHPTLQESAWIGSPPMPRVLIWPPRSWSFILKRSRDRAVARWCEQDLESTRKTLKDVCTQGRLVIVRSVTECPWM